MNITMHSITLQPLCSNQSCNVISLEYMTSVRLCFGLHISFLKLGQHYLIRDWKQIGIFQILNSSSHVQTDETRKKIALFHFFSSDLSRFIPLPVRHPSFHIMVALYWSLKATETFRKCWICKIINQINLKWYQENQENCLSIYINAFKICCYQIAYTFTDVTCKYHISTGSTYA